MLNDSSTPASLPSNRIFGMFFTGVFLVTGAYLIHSGVAWVWVAVCMVLAAAMLTLALVAP